MIPTLLALQEVGSGRIIGGWEYVWAGYALSLLAYGGYALWLFKNRIRGQHGSKETTR